MQSKNLMSIVIPTYNHNNRGSDLLDLINSLLSTLNSLFIGEIIIVDNGNSLSEPELKMIDKKIKIISESRIGLSYARNTGILHAGCDIISFVDDDVVVSSSWAEGIINGYSNNDVFCVGGPVLIDEL